MRTIRRRCTQVLAGYSQGCGPRLHEERRLDGRACELAAKHGNRFAPPQLLLDKARGEMFSTGTLATDILATSFPG